MYEEGTKRFRLEDLQQTKNRNIVYYVSLDMPVGTPAKRQVSKRQVSKRLVSKRPVSKRQVYKMSGL
jgi:hypothetical protein